MGKLAVTFCLFAAVVLAECLASPSRPPGTESPSVSPSPSDSPRSLEGVHLPLLAKVADLPGGHVSAIQYAPSRPDVLYLASDANAMGIWRSADGGASWTRVLGDDHYPNAHQTGLAVSATDPDDVISVDIHGKIWQTRDAGATWAILFDNHEAGSHWSIARSASRPARVYVGTQSGDVLASDDAGATWATRHAPDVFGTISIHPTQPDRLVAGGMHGIYASDDAGATWSKLYPKPDAPFPQVVEVAIAPGRPERILATTDRGVWRSDDAGATWRLALQAHAHGLAISASEADVAYASTTNGLYRSVDGGATWARHDAGIAKTDGRVAVHPTDPDVAILGNNIWQWQFHHDVVPPTTQGEGVFRTQDGGHSWVRSDRGFIDTDVNSIAVDPKDPNLAYVGTECSRGLYRTGDGGAAWALVPGGPEENLWDIAHYTMKVAVDRDSNLLMTGRFGFATSPDHGATWSSHLDRRHFHALGVDPRDARTLFIGTSYADDGSQDPAYYAGNHILRSQDGGRTWTDATLGIPRLPPTTFQVFAFDPSDARTIYAATSPHDILEGPDNVEVGYGVLRSRDGGLTWTPINEGLRDLAVQDLAILPGSPARLLAGTDLGVFASVDGGDHWSLLSGAMAIRSLVADPTKPDTVYAGTTRGLYASHDEGATWARLESVPDERVLGLAMDPQGRVLYAAVNNHGVYKGIRGE